MENMLCLLSNAQKFTTEGEITVRSSLRSTGSSLDAVVQQTRLFAPPLPDSESFPIAEDEKDDEKDDNDSEGGGKDTVMGGEGNWCSEAQTTPLMLLIQVEDTGIGIAKEHRERLFKPFMQVQGLLSVCLP
jgi:signal transduction histidine kinase